MSYRFFSFTLLFLTQFSYSQRDTIWAGIDKTINEFTSADISFFKYFSYVPNNLEECIYILNTRSDKTKNNFKTMQVDSAITAGLDGKHARLRTNWEMGEPTKITFYFINNFNLYSTKGITSFVLHVFHGFLNGYKVDLKTLSKKYRKEHYLDEKLTQKSIKMKFKRQKKKRKNIDKQESRDRKIQKERMKNAERL